MKPRIESIPERKLMGMRIKMSLANNKTTELWGQFMPRRNEIKNRANKNYYSVQIYNENLDFQDFNQHTEFEKWAAIEVLNFEQKVDGMETHTMKGGKYAVFIHKGLAKDFQNTFQYIFGSWLPNSEFEFDNAREQFEIMGEKYTPNDPNAEEEVWIPIK